MSLFLMLVLVVLLAAYWLIYQILPDHRRNSLIRPSLASGLLEAVNERRRESGMAMLEIDDQLSAVAENKAAHQVLTGLDDQGWDYPEEYAEMFGRSLLMEALIAGPAVKMGDRLGHQRELFDDAWVRCGIGVAGGASQQIVVALVLCRDAWDPVPDESAQRSLAGIIPR
ncbi:MAG: CAP domain-containing protein [Chloroflexota bacterium]